MCAACGTHVEYQRDHLSENPIDHVFKYGDVHDGVEATRIRHYLLQRVPPEADGRTLRSYLESIGAQCSGASHETICRYRLWVRSRTDHYLLTWRYSAGAFITTEYVVTVTAPTSAAIGKDLPLEIDSHVLTD